MKDSRLLEHGVVGPLAEVAHRAAATEPVTDLAGDFVLERRHLRARILAKMQDA